MRTKTWMAVVSLAVVALGTACSPSDQRRANDKAKQGVRAAKEDMRVLERKVDKAVGDAGVQVNSPEKAEEKLRQGAEKAREAGRRAQQKIDDATRT